MSVVFYVNILLASLKQVDFVDLAFQLLECQDCLNFELRMSISCHFCMTHNKPCFPSRILHKHCLQFSVPAKEFMRPFRSFPKPLFQSEAKCGSH